MKDSIITEVKLTKKKRDFDLKEHKKLHCTSKEKQKQEQKNFRITCPCNV